MRRKARGDDGSVVAAEKLPSKSLSEADACIAIAGGLASLLSVATVPISHYGEAVMTRATVSMHGCPSRREEPRDSQLAPLDGLDLCFSRSSDLPTIAETIDTRGTTVRQ